MDSGIFIALIIAWRRLRKSGTGKKADPAQKSI
jgi:hypothetical protein